MRKFLLAAAFLALTPAFAQAHAGPAPGPARMQALHRDVVQDRREVRAERRDVREERRDVRQSRHHLRHDRRELHRARIARAHARAWHRRHHG